MAISIPKRVAPLLAVAVVAGGLIYADWHRTVDARVPAEYVGSARCATCHAGISQSWSTSDHALAMQPANEQTVLGDFNDATFVHHGVESRMYRRENRFWIKTEGPDGNLQDFEVKYVFGIRPLQQYMVELEKPSTPRVENDNNEASLAGESKGSVMQGPIGKVQVLRVSWDTAARRWFYLSPPDVKDKLAPDDPLHWTRFAQNWNHMCADCHSTNLQKNFDLDSLTYHTTFSDMNVGCEACHGPGSKHVALANRWSLFWDRKIEYGLVSFKRRSHKFEIDTCAPCHSRRHAVSEGFQAGAEYHDFFAQEPLMSQLYYADGQIKDEVYEYGSFIQSKMYSKGIRCTDCHDPHTSRLKQTGNKLCTSCHAHHPAKYDTPAHHQHQAGSSGALCVNCHMPETPYMDVDLRRDHSLRVPRPDLSVSLKVPNSCTGCHLDRAKLPADKTKTLKYYSDWLTARDAGDAEVAKELAQIDAWAAKSVQQWFPQSKFFGQPHFASVFHAAWANDANAMVDLRRLAQDKTESAMVRASALASLNALAPIGPLVDDAVVRSLDDADPMVRLQALRLLQGAPAGAMRLLGTPLLDDPRRAVRMEAAMLTAPLPVSELLPNQRISRDRAIDEYRRGLRVHSDLATAHVGLALLAERLGDGPAAARAYRDAIRVQPDITGPRANLAQLMDQVGETEQATRLRREELRLLERDAGLAPTVAQVQYRYGLALYLAGEAERAAERLRRAHELEPTSPDYLLGWALIQQHRGDLMGAEQSVERLIKMRPDDPRFPQLLQEIRTAR